jgi:hypothetical protein
MLSPQARALSTTLLVARSGTMAAELRTANVKRVGKERATFAGYDHPAGMTVSRFKTTYAREVGLDATTLEFYEVTEAQAAALSARGAPNDSSVLTGLEPLLPNKRLDNDTWLLAVGEELAGEWLAIGTLPRRSPRAAVVLWSRCARYVFRL